MNALDLAQQNLTSPMVLAFVLGFFAVRVKSDLSFPDQVTSLLSTYLLLAIGFKGGTRLKDVDPIDVAADPVRDAGRPEHHRCLEDAERDAQERAEARPQRLDVAHGLEIAANI